MSKTKVLFVDDEERVVVGLQSLPSVPALYQQITQELTSEDPSINGIADIVARGIAMTAKVLQLANSAFFALCRTITSTSQAVSLLGTETITALVLSTELFRGAESGDLAVEKVWLRSLLVASLAKAIVLSEAGSASAAAEAFVAGVLHDCGKLVLAQTRPDQYVELLEQGLALE